MTTETTFEVEPGATTLLMSRVFDAPRELVWEASTKCEHMKRWWGPARMELVVCEIDLRVGGGYRFVQRDQDGSEHPFKGEFLEVDPPRRLVQTFVYDVEGIRDYPATTTITLEDVDGKTRLTGVTDFHTVENRDMAIATGMESGARESWDRLAALLAELQ